MGDALEYLKTKYNLDYTQPSPFFIPMGRGREVPYMLNRLGFKVGAEIGVYQGNYSKDLLRRISGLKLYGIDCWENYEGYKDFNMYQQQHIHEAYEIAKENVKGYDCELIKMYSTDAAKLFKDESLDFVFIDGNHDYEHVVEDIAAWSKKVRRGGVIYGHDYVDMSNRKGRWRKFNVINAVDGWMKSYKIKPWFVLTNNKYNCWLYVKE